MGKKPTSKPDFSRFFPQKTGFNRTGPIWFEPVSGPVRLIFDKNTVIRFGWFFGSKPNRTVNTPNHATLFSEQCNEQWSYAPLLRPDWVWSNVQNVLNWIRPSKIKNIFFYFFIVFYSLDDVVFTEFNHNSNFFLIIFYKLCCCVLKKSTKVSVVFQTW